MTAIWPRHFPCVERATWTEQEDTDQIIAFKPDVGAEKLREPVGEPVVFVSCDLTPCTSTVKAQIETWRRERGRLAPFVFETRKHGRGVYRLRAIKWADISNDYWRATLEMERLP